MATKPAKVSLDACPHCDLPIEEVRGQCIRHLPQPRDQRAKKSFTSRKFTSADDIAKQIVKDRDGWTCRRCPKTKDQAQMHAAHIWPSTYKRLRKGFSKHTGYACCLRHDPANMLTMCTGDHLFWAHRNPNDFVAWVIKEIGQEAYDDLEAQAKQKMQPGELALMGEKVSKILPRRTL